MTSRMANIWLPSKAGRRYFRKAYVCEGVFAAGRWLAHPFDESRIADPCGYVEPPGTPQRGRGYHCPRCGGALRWQSVEASYVDCVEGWVEESYLWRSVARGRRLPRQT